MRNSKISDFLFGCKNLYHLSIHPFDFDKSQRTEYKQLIGLGKEIMDDIGVRSFSSFLIEYQYRVAKWTAFIVLEYGRPDPQEILERGPDTIYNACLEEVEKDEIKELPPEIKQNINDWVEKVKTCYNNI